MIYRVALFNELENGEVEFHNFTDKDTKESAIIEAIDLMKIK